MAAKKTISPANEDCDVFVSYSHEGNPHNIKVAKLVEGLRAKGWKTAWDGDHKKEPDETWAAYMANMLKKAKHVVVVLSKSYGERSGSKAELNSIRTRNAKNPKASRYTQVYFDKAYDDPDYKSANSFSEIGGSIIPLTNPEPARARRWKDLTSRIDAVLAEEPNHETSASEESMDANDGTSAKNLKHSNGIILVGDIVGFSDQRKFTKHVQHLVLRQMWTFIAKNKLIKDLHAHVDSTLDGAIIVLDENDHEDDIPLEVHAIQFARAWLEFMRGGIRMNNKVLEVGFRIGIDSGPYSLFSISHSDTDGDPDEKEAPKDAKIIGAGPNDCDRLTRIGDAYDIILSVRFYDAWRAEVGNDVKGKVLPVPSQPAFEVFPKPHHRQEVRIYTGHRTDRNLVPPIALRQSKVATAAIWKNLKDMAVDYRDWLFEDLVETLDSAKSKDELKEAKRRMGAVELLNPRISKVRVSIFCPKPDDPEDILSCTTFRYIEGVRSGSAEHSRLIQPSTEYSIQGKGDGLVGRAFRQEKPIVIWDLPNWSEEPDEYLRKMRKHGMEDAVVRSFPRHPRVTIAFGCRIGDLPTDACICLDAMSGMGEYFDSDAFTGLAGYLQRTYGSMIALLLRVKG